MKKVLVTGATGFIGRHSLQPLLARNFEVHAVSSRPATAMTPGVAHHVCDLFDAAATARLVSELRPTHLLHFAWFAEHGSFWTSEENLRWIEASLALARAFRKHGGSRLVATGTCAEYDWTVSDLAESSPAVPATLYGASKHALQIALSAWGKQFGVSVAWGRVFFMYGPHEQPGRLVASVIRAALERREAKCSEGTQIRDFQHVSDTAGSMVALLDSPVEGVVNIASGRPVAIKDVVLAIADRLDARQLVRLGALPIAPNDPPALRASITRLRDEVGWQDRLDLGAGLDDAIGWWRTQGAAR